MNGLDLFRTFVVSFSATGAAEACLSFTRKEFERK